MKSENADNRMFGGIHCSATSAWWRNTDVSKEVFKKNCNIWKEGAKDSIDQYFSVRLELAKTFLWNNSVCEDIVTRDSIRALYC